jgi:hypothetical protein
LQSSGYAASVTIHFLAQAQRAHIGPNYIDVRQAFLSLSGLSRVFPARSVISMGGPN